MDNGFNNNVNSSSDMINYDVVKIENAYKCLEDMRELESDSNYGKLKNGYHMDYPSDRYKIDDYKDKIDSPSCTNDAIKLLAYNIVTLTTVGATFSSDIILKAGNIISGIEMDEFGNYDDGDDTVRVVNLGVNSGDDYIIDIYDLIRKNNSSIIYNGDMSSFYNDTEGYSSGMEYVNKELDSILKNYSGRYAVVNSALKAIELAADKNVRIRYRHEGSNLESVPYNTNEQLVKGMDCCEFVSWAINKGSSEPFHWLGVSGLYNNGQKIEYEEALPGDIFVKYTDTKKHVGLIIANDSANQTYIVAEAGGEDTGIWLHESSYASLKTQGYQINSYEEYYDDISSNDTVLKVDNIIYKTEMNEFENYYDDIFLDDIVLKTDNITYETETNEFENYDDGDGAVKEVNEGPHTGTLNAPKGFITDGPGGPNGEPVYETWYDYKMSNVVDAMKNRGYDYDYSVDEETGIKMFGPYVMVAADVKNVANPDGTYNYGDIVETSVGTGMVVDYCGEAATKRENSNGIHFDIATAWHTKPYQARAYSKEEVEKAKGNATGM